VDSPAGWAQTAIRSFRAFASPPGSPDRARPGETTVLVTLDAGTESRNVPAHPFSLSPFLPLTLSPTLSSSHTGPHGRRGKRSALDGVPPTSSSATFVSYANADVQMHLRNPRTQPPNLTPLPPAPFLLSPLCVLLHTEPTRALDWTRKSSYIELVQIVKARQRLCLLRLDVLPLPF